MHASHTPPTQPGELPTAPSWKANRILLGMAIHAGVVMMTCFGIAIAMGSNIWPIAGVFWSVLTVPVALATGSISGLCVRRASHASALYVLFATAIALAAIVAIIMANNR